ncbi:MliC family protein [Jiella marina]|uniref:MliC family protein n=1 Tax=Jiella sp. LLJ827 TaxID=2917712 RepID=UPI0021006AC0|nr:MliC family protein [Jiella sp. LLJ827]MCQ0988261.1 MliC family protein [Jiella sp. LLJ827]
MRHRRSPTYAQQMRRRSFALGGLIVPLLLGAGPAHPLDLDLPGEAERTIVTYECRDSAEAEPRPLAVEYINLPGNNFAVLPIDGRPTLFVSVISGSGAKYVAREKVWWTKGRRGDLFDVNRQDASETTVCRLKRG